MYQMTGGTRMKSKLGKVMAFCLAAVLLLGGCGSDAEDARDAVYVDSVGKLAGVNGFAGTQNRYAGLVEPQKTLQVNPEQGRTVKTALVEEGQSVEEGDPLFVYDTEELEMSLEQANLEIERIDNSISNYYSEISALQAEKDKASEDNQLQYTVEIQNRYASIKQEEYNRKVKLADIDKLKSQIENDTVTSTMAGVVQTIDDTVLNGNSSDNYGNQKYYITILASGEYRVKAKINEQNVHQISVGEAVIIRSRVFEDKTWTGVIDEIDTSKTDNSDNQNNFYYGGSTDTSTTTSKYPFYIVLDSYDGLILGQHVYVELASASASSEKSSLAIPSVYLVQEGESYYVWAEDNGKLVKRQVTVGEYYEAEDTYEILEGLAAEDYIAFPQEDLKEGMKTTRNNYANNPQSQEGNMEQ